MPLAVCRSWFFTFFLFYYCFALFSPLHREQNGAKKGEGLSNSLLGLASALMEEWELSISEPQPAFFMSEGAVFWALGGERTSGVALKSCEAEKGPCRGLSLGWIALNVIHSTSIIMKSEVVHSVAWTGSPPSDLWPCWASFNPYFLQTPITIFSGHWAPSFLIEHFL